jgi:haloacetate dehalogenase
MFEGFELSTIDAGEATIRVRHGGAGPPLLLLHGYPQTHAMWHRVAPRLARDFTVVATDLRGYGDSSKPPTTSDHEPYSKRAMARDQIEVMAQLGFDDFFVVGHDRGARCAYRMALDHPKRVRRLAVLDIIPTSEAYRRTDMGFALGAWHWFLLPQPYDLPERFLGADPEGFYFGPRKELFAPQALEEYLRCLRDPRTIHAICEDYRGGRDDRLRARRARPRRATHLVPGARALGSARPARQRHRRTVDMARVGRPSGGHGTRLRPPPAGGGTG